MNEQQYEFDARRGDTVQAQVAVADPPIELDGQVTAVAEHGWYRDLAVVSHDKIVRLRLYREPEHRKHSPVIKCQLLRRRDLRWLPPRFGLD